MTAGTDAPRDWSSPRIRFDGHNAKHVKVTPVDHLGADFYTYLDACRAVRGSYEKSLRAQLVPIERLRELMAALQAKGFQVSVGPELADRLNAERAEAERKNAEAVASVQAATDRLEQADGELAKRGLRLYPFQRTGVRWLAARRQALLADEMGLGKTVQALIAIPEGSPVVVVAPAAVKGVWRSEARRWRPDLRPIVLQGRDSFRWPEPGQMVICNYDVLPRAVDQEGNEPEKGSRPKLSSLFVTAPNEPAKGTVVIADEAHALKNKKANRTRRFLVLAKHARDVDGRVWLLTGTPLLNRPPELWNVLDAADIAKEAFGNYNRFRALFGGYSTRFGTEWGQAKTEVPELLRKVSLHRRRVEVLPDLPTKTYAFREITEIDLATRRFLDEIQQALLDRGIDITEDHFDTEKIGAAGFEELSRARAALATAKTPAMLEVVEEYEEAGELLVVFSAHRSPVDILGKRPKWAAITGDVSPEERTRIVEAFQAGELKGVALTIQAGGVGLTLTRGAALLFVDLAWTPALNQQAEDRCCRIGQDRGVMVTRLVVDHPIDQRVIEVLSAKQALIAGSVEASARVDVAEKDVLNLHEVPETPQFETHAAGGFDRQRPGFRQANGPTEEWAGNGLLALAAMDPDHAGVVNGVGFSKMDNDFGHSLAMRLRAGEGLTDKQWAAAIRLATRYRRQIGAPPDVE